jgi:hypothetical protein
MSHITVVTRRPSRRIQSLVTNDSGARRQLCGGAPTDRDILLRDAERMARRGLTLSSSVTCEACIQRCMDRLFNNRHED